jgi:hypothetical protein
LVTVVVPYIVAPLVCWLQDRSDDSRRVAGFALVTGLLSALLGLALTSVMEAEHVTHSPFPVMFTASSHLGASLANLLAAWVSLAGGAFFGLPAAGANLLTAVAGLLSLAALAAVSWTLYKRARASVQGPVTTAVVDSVRELYGAFFALVLFCTFLVYLGTNLSLNVGGSEHYLLGGWVAVAALLGLLLSYRPVALTILVAVAIFGLITLRGHIADGVPPLGSGPDRPTALGISDFAASHGAHIGYAEYWDASPVTWGTHLGAEVFPIGPCPVALRSPSGLCPFVIGTISSWFTPRTNTPTFLITDNRTWIAGYVASPPSSFGRPVAAAHFGPYTVSVYRYDLAAALGP